MFSWLNPIVYVQVEQNTFVLLHAQSNNQHTAKSATPFANSRLAVANFKVAESLLKESLVAVLPRSISRVSPTVVMHQRYLSEGGLSQVEERVLNELGYGAGARKVYLWQGSDLTTDKLLNKGYIGGV